MRGPGIQSNAMEEGQGPGNGQQEGLKSPSQQLLLFALWPLEGLLQILTGFFQCAEGVVVGLDGLPVFIDGALALAGDIEDLAELDVAPDFRPARVAVAVDRRAIGVGGGLIVSLQKENFCDAVVGEGAVLVDVERLVELSQRAGEVALLLHSLTAEDG